MRQSRIHADPDIQQIQEFLSTREIDFFIRLGTPILHRSAYHKNEVSSQETIRNSDSAYFSMKMNFHPVLHRVRCRAAALCGQSFRQVEILQICRYQPGQQFTPHFDYFSSRYSFPASAGQRLVTVLVYLSTLSNGSGATSFPRLGLSIQPQKGVAIMWHNLLPEGTPDENTQHAGTPVTGDDEKWIMNIWVREKSVLPGYLRRLIKSFSSKRSGPGAGLR